MHIELEPYITGLPIGAGVLTHAQMHEAAEAMFNSAQYIEHFGDPVTPTEEDAQIARSVLQDTKHVSAVQTSATAMQLKALLNEYDFAVAQTAAQIRMFVTNSLIEEAAPGSKNRLRALELLGKISEVGLFTERSEVTVKHQTTTELEDKVRAKIAMLRSKTTNVQDLHVNEDITDTVHDQLDLATDVLLQIPAHVAAQRS